MNEPSFGATGRRGLRFALAASVLGAALGIAQHAPAQPVETQDRAAARELGHEGIDLYQRDKYEEALDRLTRAHAIVRLTTTGLWRARCLARLGRLVEATEQYLEVTRMELGPDALEVHRQARDEARQEREALLPRLARARLLASRPPGADTTVSLDGKPVPAALFGVPRPIDPGEHRVVVERAGYRQTIPFACAEGASIDVPILLESARPTGSSATGAASTTPEPPPEEPGGDSTPSAPVVLGWTALGLGGAAVVAGVVTGALALERKGTLDDGCTEGDCPPPLHGDVDAFYALRTASLVCLVSGGALVVGGFVLVLAAPSAEQGSDGATSARLQLGPAGLRLSGRF